MLSSPTNTGALLSIGNLPRAIIAFCSLACLISFSFFEQGLTYLFAIAAYNLFLHPLRRYPGPKLWAASRIPYSHAYLSGQMHKKILALHKEYGPIVRIAPDELAYNHPDAWKHLHGHLKNGTGDHGRDPVFTRDNKHSLIGAGREDHARFRRALSRGFSAQSMHEQEPIIKKYVDLLFQRLDAVAGSGPVNMVAWYNWTTFDIIGDLVFGEPFGCLAESKYHPWVKILFEGIKANAYKMNIQRYPLIQGLLMRFMPAELKTKREQHFELTREKVGKRLSMEAQRPDFMDSMTRKTGDQALRMEELYANSAALILAGSETTATALSATTYYLVTHGGALEKLQKEVRSAFSSEDEIDILSTQKLEYAQAVVNEGLRMFPPVPTGFMRRVMEGDGVFLGQHVPRDTLVQAWHWPIYHNPAYFALPNDFVPERWLGDVRFANDCREAFQPFSVGPKGCIGKNLAYAEMRLILARMVWSFDMSIADESRGWDERGRVYLAWEKGPLNVYLSPRKLE
ncbi:Trichothecene C-15 hydroxylase [Colletotrichum trifolii]|uniref:Trichothecene C-15 hydroxylase n=1 Tax=Colletotrichum trifolii TaxID=5466 RepID=A0A4R8RUQ4_COLTR|nr:Trichothecene C-15 hydroxylase [Colletotrichum trifolii]